MSLILAGEKEFQVAIANDVDTVLCAIDIPAGCTLRSVSVPCQVLGVSAALEMTEAVAYAAAAYVFPVEDPDTRVDYNVLWDRFVPKYTDVDLIDLDTTTAVTTPFWEPGEGSFEDIFDMGRQPQRVFSRKRRMNFADPGSSGFRFQPAETPFVPQWIPDDTFHMRMNRGISVKAPSVFILAMASPQYDDTTTTRVQLGENQWGQIQYTEATLERALMDQLAITEAGATTPWLQASDTLRTYLAPDTFEETAASFIANAWRVFGVCEWSLQVPGTMDFSRVDLTP